jgi:DNA mismatch repair protein MutL
LSVPANGADAVAAEIEATEPLSQMDEPEESELAQLRPLGQVRESFVVAAGPTGLWLIDQHAAHERVLFERFLSQRENGCVESQRLLMPYVLRLTPAQQLLWDELAPEMESAGFEAEPFGQNTVVIKAAPADVKPEDVEKLLHALVETMEKEARGLSREVVRNKIAASVACHAAIKINTPLEPRKMEWLVGALAATRFPMSCPHGRPVILKYGMRDILKAFHRI